MITERSNIQIYLYFPQVPICVKELMGPESNTWTAVKPGEVGTTLCYIHSVEKEKKKNHAIQPNVVFNLLSHSYLHVYIVSSLLLMTHLDMPHCIEIKRDVKSLIPK